MAASSLQTEKLTDKPLTHSIRRVSMRFLLSGELLLFAAITPLLLPLIAPLSQSGNACSTKRFVQWLGFFFFYLRASCLLLHLRCCPLWGFVLSMYFGMSVWGKWPWQADLGWLTLLTWLFVHWVLHKRVVFWVICLDCIFAPLSFLSHSQFLFFSVCVLGITGFQWKESQLVKALCFWWLQENSSSTFNVLKKEESKSEKR